MRHVQEANSLQHRAAVSTTVMRIRFRQSCELVSILVQVGHIVLVVRDAHGRRIRIRGRGL